MYLLCIPSMYLLLTIYSITNLNVVSWGTREVAVKKSKKEMEEEKKQVHLIHIKIDWFTKVFYVSIKCSCIWELFKYCRCYSQWDMHFLDTSYMAFRINFISYWFKFLIFISNKHFNRNHSPLSIFSIYPYLWLKSF